MLEDHLWAIPPKMFAIDSVVTDKTISKTRKDFSTKLWSKFVDWFQRKRCFVIVNRGRRQMQYDAFNARLAKTMVINSTKGTQWVESKTC